MWDYNLSGSTAQNECWCCTVFWMCKKATVCQHFSNIDYIGQQGVRLSTTSDASSKTKLHKWTFTKSPNKIHSFVRKQYLRKKWRAMAFAVRIMLLCQSNLYWGMRDTMKPCAPMVPSVDALHLTLFSALYDKSQKTITIISLLSSVIYNWHYNASSALKEDYKYSLPRFEQRGSPLFCFY